jgi:DHA1 family inner membrane transport protein
VLAVYSFIAPLLIDRAGVPASMVPLVLTGFGIGSFIGTLLGGRLGDTRPHAVTIVTPAITTMLMLAIFLLSESSWAFLLSESSWAMIAAVVALGLFGLSANSVLIHLAVRFAGTAATLGSALSVSAFNVGTAVTTPIAGAALTSPLGLDGPAAVGTVIVALTLIPTIALAQIRRRAAAANQTSRPQPSNVAPSRRSAVGLTAVRSQPDPSWVSHPQPQR